MSPNIQSLLPDARTSAARWRSGPLYALDTRMLIRTKKEKDSAAVHALNVAAFETPAEANLVDALRQQARPVVSLVAEEDQAVVGHIMFSPVDFSGHPELMIMGLAPMAATPEHQRIELTPDIKGFVPG